MFKKRVSERAEESAGKKPVHTIVLPAGKGAQIQASIWENAVENGENSFTSYAVTVVRRYREGDEWKTATGFRMSDLLIVAKAVNLAYDALIAE